MFFAKVERNQCSSTGTVTDLCPNIHIRMDSVYSRMDGVINPNQVKSSYAQDKARLRNSPKRGLFPLSALEVAPCLSKPVSKTKKLRRLDCKLRFLGLMRCPQFARSSGTIFVMRSAEIVSMIVRNSGVCPKVVFKGC